jgi:hypothetical protein
VVLIFIYRSIMIRPVRMLINVHYPFSFNSSIIWNLVYVHQIMAMCYVTVIILADAIIILLNLTSTMKLKLLHIQFQNMKTYSDLVNCVREHQKIIW